MNAESGKFRVRSALGMVCLFMGLAAVGCEQRDRGTAGAEVRRGREGAAQDQGQKQATPGAGQQATPTAEPIREVEVLIITADRMSLLNRQVDVVGAEVQKVSNDRVFWIGTAADRSVPVYLDDQTRGSLQQSQTKVQKGQKVALVGDLRQAPAVTQMEQLWGLSAGDAEQLSKSQVYLHARRLLVGQEGQQGAQPGQQGAQGQPGVQPQGGQQGAQGAQPQGGQQGAQGAQPQGGQQQGTQPRSGAQGGPR